MDKGRQRAEWDRTALLSCLIFNANRDPAKVAAARPDDFNPYAPPSPPRPKAKLTDFKGAFVRQ